MSRLTKAEQAEYEEEADYSAETGATRYPARTPYERAREAAATVAGYGRQVSEGARSASRKSGLDEWAARMNAGAPATTPRSRSYYAGAPVNETSSMHPGNSIIVMQGRVLASSQTARQAPRQPPRRPAFGFDDGM